ncbi:MAG: alpha/beta hydrolase [Desulfuromonadaceae bacterium]|nr:alpha/beta hydrolase [Desulfuromonadaceae bacterium]
MQKYGSDRNSTVSNTSSETRVRVVLLPGLATDERMYVGVQDALEKMPTGSIFKLVTPHLLVPNKGENMEVYALRTAKALNIQTEDVIGGCSFGAMVASAIAAQVPVKGLVLLSGALDSSALASSGRMLNRIAPVIPFSWLQRVLASDWFLHSVFGAASPAEIKFGRDMLLDTPAQTLRRGGVLAATSRLTTPLSIPIYALHGTDDRVLRTPEVENCKLLPDAGHGMVVSHPQEVAAFLCDSVAAIEGRHSQRR